IMKKDMINDDLKEKVIFHVNKELKYNFGNAIIKDGDIVGTVLRLSIDSTEDEDISDVLRELSGMRGHRTTDVIPTRRRTTFLIQFSSVERTIQLYRKEITCGSRTFGRLGWPTVPLNDPIDSIGSRGVRIVLTWPPIISMNGLAIYDSFPVSFHLR
ncbi:hypothetical protein PMAYCL1PPCAC_24340, partial [Pristionchus mayeri]